jgi:2-methylaconitate cis-trans-isomerase PrpF
MFIFAADIMPAASRRAADRHGDAVHWAMSGAGSRLSTAAACTCRRRSPARPGDGRRRRRPASATHAAGRLQGQLRPGAIVNASDIAFLIRSIRMIIYGVVSNTSIADSSSRDGPAF